LLSSTENHFYNCSSDADWQYLIARAKISDVSATEILDLLAKLGNIDADLWKRRIIWCQQFVDNLSEVYRKRKRELPQKPISFISATEKQTTAPETPQEPPQSATENTQSRVKESRVKKEIIKEKISLIENRFVNIPNALMEKWREVSPGININDEIKKAELWLLSNPEKRRSRYESFLSKWMVKAQNDFIKYGGKGNGNKPVIKEEKSPYVFCERCGGEVRPDDFITEGGIKFCFKCPEIKTQKGLTRVNNLIGSIGKQMPAAAL